MTAGRGPEARPGRPPEYLSGARATTPQPGREDPRGGPPGGNVRGTPARVVGHLDLDGPRRVLLRLPRSGGDELRVVWRQAGGGPVLELRRWRGDGPGTWRPAAEGIEIPADEIGGLCGALAVAQGLALADGPEARDGA